MTSKEQQQLAQWTIAAQQLGREAGAAAAGWIVDGNTKTELIPAVLQLMDDGDPRMDEYLPPRPDLSGEWADEMTPGKLYEQVTGRDAHGDSSWNYDSYQELLSTLCDAWEAGVDETFIHECERVLRAAL